MFFNNAESLPPNSNAHVWPSADAIITWEGEEDLDARNVQLAQMSSMEPLPSLSPSSSVSSLSRSSSSSSLAASISTADSEAPAILNLASLNDDNDPYTEQGFVVEAKASLERALKEDHTVDNASIELKTLRMASNVALSEVREVVIQFLCSTCETDCDSGASVRDRLTAMSKIVSRWGSLLGKLGQMGEQDMVESVLSLQRWCSTSEDKIKRFPLWLKVFYEEDVVDGDAVIEWWKISGTEASTAGLGRRARDLAMPLVKALAEDSSEEEDSE